MLTPYLSLTVWLFEAELGDLATWIGAIANLATVLLAVVASLVGFRVYRIESGRDQRAEGERRERAEDDRRGQAQLVSAWYGRSLRPSTGSTSRSSVVIVNEEVWAVQLLNASNLPVYDVQVSLIKPDDSPAPPPLVTKWIPVVPPYQGPQSVGLGMALREPRDDGDRPPFDIHVRLEFRDSAGRRWLRDWDGLLSEVPKGPR